jgi:hypothetical protein
MLKLQIASSFTTPPGVVRGPEAIQGWSKSNLNRLQPIQLFFLNEEPALYLRVGEQFSQPCLKQQKEGEPQAICKA